MQRCLQVAHCCSACYCGCSDALRMDPSVAYSHRSDKVSVGVPLAPTDCNDSAWTLFSLAVVCSCCALRVRADVALVHRNPASSAADQLLWITAADITSAPHVIMSVSIPPVPRRPSRPPIRPLRLHRCSIVRAAASISSRSCSAQPSSRSTCTGSQGMR
jgi:hypothetical protein